MHNKYMKSYAVESAVAAYLIVKPGVSGGVVPAAAATDALLGTNDNIYLATGQTGDFSITGESFVKLGGTVALMDPLTSDANGKAIKAVPAAGTNNRIIGYALQAGVANDVITYIGQPATYQG